MNSAGGAGVSGVRSADGVGTRTFHNVQDSNSGDLVFAFLQERTCSDYDRTSQTVAN